MYRCQLCGRVSPPRSPSFKVVLQRRSKRYAFRPKANRVCRPDKNDKMKEQFTDDPGGVGWEVDREAVVCGACRSDPLPGTG